ncbi:MAG: protein-disulfide reductase DsbD domain-containing protein [Pyrinomonadaceae bacterium]
MTRSIHVTNLCLLLLLVASACSKPVQNSGSESPTAPAATSPLVEDKRVTSVGVVKAAAQPVEMTAGSSAEASVQLTIQSGYHINANPPTYPYLIATTLDISPADGISAGSVTYPKPLNRKFVFAEKPLAVYEGETKVKAKLKADKSARQGQQSLPAKLRIQACDEQVCYPPGTLDLVIPVSIN